MESAKINQPGFLATQILPVTVSRIQSETFEQRDGKWLDFFQQNSQFLMAAIAPGRFTLCYVNDYFCRLTGLSSTQTLSEREITLFDLFANLNRVAVEQLYRRQILQLVLEQLYQINLPGFFEESIITWVSSDRDREPRQIEFWLRCSQLRVTRLDIEVDEFANLDWQQVQVEDLESLLLLENYRVEGLLLLEGLDVTVRETLKNLTQLLIEPESILTSQKLVQVGDKMRSLFRAPKIFILTVENDQMRLLINPGFPDEISCIYQIKCLQKSHFLRAASANSVWNVLDLSKDCQTDCEQQLLEIGIRSMLLIPLNPTIAKTPLPQIASQQLVGMVGLACDRPNHFNRQDCQHAQFLVPALTTALRGANQRRVTRIHPAVEWRFLLELERRSWGLPPEPIIFKDVYPLYGISDIRGSSTERNLAIQADLLEQFRLGKNIVEAVCQARESALAEQLRLDLWEYAEKLRVKINVDAEVTAVQYLKDNLEIYFDYFAQSSDAACEAVKIYINTCSNQHDSVYIERDRYDQRIGQINALLLETWNRWQVRMQKVTAHYCDIDTTDGIDHMIYTGASVDPKFTAFHLHSLRYEQLRAVCDCARTAFELQQQSDINFQLTHLVLVQDITMDIVNEQNTERLFEIRGTHDTRYEIVKKRIDKACDAQTKTRITQPGMLTVVYSTDKEWAEYQQYLRYLTREGWIESQIDLGVVEPLQGVTGLKFARVRVLPQSQDA